MSRIVLGWGFKHHLSVFGVVLSLAFGPTSAGAEVPLEVTAEELAATLRGNTARAEFLYGNRELVIFGTVHSVARGCCGETQGYHYVNLEPYGIRPVKIQLHRDTSIESIASLETNQRYRFLCQTAGLDTSGGMVCAQGRVID